MSKKETSQINEAEIEHSKALYFIKEMVKRDEALIKQVFPNGYEDIKLPVDRLAFCCPRCSARISYVYRTCKNKDGQDTLFVCQCFRCDANYAIFRKGKQINVAIFNYDIK